MSALSGSPAETWYSTILMVTAIAAEGVARLVDHVEDVEEAAGCIVRAKASDIRPRSPRADVVHGQKGLGQGLAVPDDPHHP